MHHLSFAASALIGAFGLFSLLEGHLLTAVSCHLLAGVVGMAGVSERGFYEWSLAAMVPFAGGALVGLHHIGTSLSRPESVAGEYSHYLDAEERLGDQILPQLRPEISATPDHLLALSDVLRSRAPISDKRQAIEALAAMETPRSVQVLRQALTSPSTEVRFYAASVLGQLEERLSQHLIALEQDITIGLRSDPAVELELAHCCFDFAYFDLVDADRRPEYLKKAILYARRANNTVLVPDAWLLEGRALLELHEPLQAEKVFSRYLRYYPKNNRGYLWRAQARFQAGNVAGVIEDCKKAYEAGDAPRPMIPVLKFWIPKITAALETA